MARRRVPTPRVPIKNAREQESMRRAGRIVALAHTKVGEAIKPGVTTGDLDAVAEQTIRGLGGVPSFLGYRGYPATACVSINDEVVHGIPGPRPLREGDIVSVDLGAIFEGFHADAAMTHAVGEVSAATQALMEAGQNSLAAGIAAAQAGRKLRDVAAAIQQYVESRGFSVVRELCGHGVGRKLHEEPQIPNYVTHGLDLILEPGMALAIEPMVNAGSPGVFMQPDGWTFVTVDGKLSVHYEHTVLIQEDGPEIITTLR